jgi:hypothetical protein
MTHYELMHVANRNDPRTALICARFNLRSGKRRLQKGLTMEGMIALYDSMLFGMHYYITRHTRCQTFAKNIDFWDGTSLFQALARAGVFDDPLTFNRLSFIVERTLWQPTVSFNAEATLAEVENFLAKLGVLPFSESIRPRG